MNHLRMEANENPLTGSDRPIPDIAVRVWRDGERICAKVDVEPEEPDVVALVYQLLLARRHALETVYKVARNLSAAGDEDGKAVVLACLEAEDRLTGDVMSPD